MRRRDLLAAGAAAAFAGLPSPTLSSAAESAPASTPKPQPPLRIAGMTLAELRDDYRRRLFDEYLPFWEKGAIDRTHGGFFCELNNDGSVAVDEKFIWYQGRGIWAYSFLYNEFGKDPRWLDIARQGRDFMIQHMHAGGGKWYEKVRGDGTLIQGVGETVFGWLFAALGLAEYYHAAGEKEDLALASESLRAAIKAYDDPNYTDSLVPRNTGLDVDPRGLRSQGHSMVIVAVLDDMLRHQANSRLEDLQQQHVERIVKTFWNPQYRIVNEYLTHDYSRPAGADAYMLTGHSVETLWFVMTVALYRKDRELFETAAARVRHLLEMCWDYVFDGFGDGNFYVFGTKDRSRGPGYDVKTMWAQCDAMIACMMVLEHTGADWARQWYERLWAYTIKVMPVPGLGVWRQAVDRRGNDAKRVGISTKRKDNFHQVRFLMLNLLSIERMLGRK